jgi:DNA-binding HxlR family transcriptional regulator
LFGVKAFVRQTTGRGGVLDDRRHMRRAGRPANGPLGKELRAGGRALLLLSDPIKVSILRTLAGGPLEGGELGDRLPNVSRSTRFERLRELENLDVITREKRSSVPPLTICRLAPAGIGLLLVATLLETWLEGAPDQPLELADATATHAVKALSLAWDSTLLGRLAERPRSLSELEPLIAGVRYRELERILRNLIEVGLAERIAGRRRLRPYALTRWARKSVVPLIAAIRWERRHIPGHATSVTALDLESAFTLALPLVELRAGFEGTCLLLVDGEAVGSKSLGEVPVQILDDRLASYMLADEVAGREWRWVRGSVSAWVDAVLDGRATKLQSDFPAELAADLVIGLREALQGRSNPLVGRLFDSCQPQ